MTEYGVTEIFHLAAQAIVGVALAQPAETLDVNVRGTWSLLEAARRHASPLEAIVVMSSDKAYGRLSGDLYSETMPLAGEAPYDASKSCADLIARSYAVSYGMPISVCRPGNAFGPGDYNISRIFPSTILAVLSGKRPQIRSDGSSVRDYVYAGDIADALVNVAEATRKSGLKGQAFNVAYGSVHSVMAVTKLILRMMDSDLEPEILSVATHEIPEQRLAHARIDALQSGKWKHGFEEGVRETIAWYRSAFVRGHIRPIG